MRSIWLLIICMTVIAAPVKRHHFAGYEDLKQGELNGTGLTSDGRILRTPSFDTVATLSESYIWDACMFNGKLYVTAGEKAKVYEIDPADGNVRLLTFFKEGTAYAIAAFQNQLMVGLSPSGMIMKVDPATGKHEPAVTLKARYIWRMVPSAGYLWISTGMPGSIFRMDRTMDARPVATELDDHVEALAVSGNRLVAGTAPNGLLFEQALDGQPYLLTDTPYTEIRDVIMNHNSLTAACYNGKPGVKTDGKTKPAREVRKLKPIRGGIIRIDRNRAPVPVMSFTTMAPLCLSSNTDGVLVGTGHSGKLLSVQSNRQFTVLGEVDAGQIVRFIRYRDTTLFVTANPGRVFRMENRFDLEGRYTAPPIMSERPVTWGRIYLDTREPRGSRVELRVRAGNSATPDANWTPWRVVRSGETPDLPASTGLQWQVRLISQDPQITPEVTAVTVYGRELNLSPRIRDVTVYPPGIWIAKDATQNPNAIVPVRARTALKRKVPDSTLKTAFRAGMQTLRVQADDPNGDDLRYSVWAVPDSGDPIELAHRATSSILAFHTGQLPEGRYRFRVTVSDILDNYPDPGEVTRDSEPFTVDRSAPTVSEGERDGSGLTLTVTDRLSVVDTVRISRDGGKHWQVIWPMDGIPDGSKEQYRIDPVKGSVIIQAVDDHGNATTALITSGGTRQ